MKKVFYGPYYRLCTRLVMGKKIIGKASKDEIENLAKIVAKTISKIQDQMTEQNMYEKLLKGYKKLIYTKPVFNANSGTDGYRLLNSIYIDKDTVEKTIESKSEQLKDDYDYHTIVHETIHLLQKKSFYKGKLIRGFLEGATDLMANRAVKRKRSCESKNGKVAINFPYTLYINEVSIMAQLEIVFGKKTMEDFALTSDNSLLEKLEEMLGKEMFNQLRKDMNADCLKKETQYKFTDWQNIILNKAFEREIRNVNTVKEAEQFLDKLKEMEKVRIRVEGDNYFPDYYNKKFHELKSRFPEIDENKYEYKECEFYPTIYEDERIKKMDNIVLSIMPVPENIEEFSRIDLGKYKRYRSIIDGNICEAVLEDGKIKSVSFIDKKGNINKLLSAFYLKGRNLDIEDIISISSGRIYINPIFLNGKQKENIEMEEIPLNINKKDIYNKMLEKEKMDLEDEGIFERMRRKLSKTKRLPPYSQVSSKIDDKKENKSWELTAEEKEKLIQPSDKDENTKNVRISNELSNDR